MKICKDCQWASPDPSASFWGTKYRWIYAKCERRVTPLRYELVTGEPMRDPVYCAIEREHGDCGPSGKFFIAREKRRKRFWIF